MLCKLIFESNIDYYTSFCVNRGKYFQQLIFGDKHHLKTKKSIIFMNVASPSEKPFIGRQVGHERCNGETQYNQGCLKIDGRSIVVT